MFESGSSIEFDVIVTTQRNATAGPMVVEVPIPSSLTSSSLMFCGAKLKDIGENVICAQEGDIKHTPSSWYIRSTNQSLSRDCSSVLEDQFFFVAINALLSLLVTSSLYLEANVETVVGLI